MRGYTFNQQLLALREDRGLSRKEAAKAMGLPRLWLSLYEGGYFRPKGKALSKIEAFYGAKLDFFSEKDYPARIEEEAKPLPSRKKKLLLRGVFSVAMALCLGVGTGLFLQATRNDASYYGDTYTALYRAARASGKTGTEMATNAAYHYLESPDVPPGSILFYDASSFLHFNECHYACNLIYHERPEIGSGRLTYRFGGDLASDSHRCYFTYGNTTYGNIITCEALYYGEPVTKLENIVTRVEGEGNFDEQTLLMLFNFEIPYAIKAFDQVLEAHCGEGTSFLRDFLPDREKGRTVAFVLQIVGLSMIMVGTLGLFIGLSMLCYVGLRGLRLPAANEEASPQKRELPRDFHAPFALPDFFMLGLTKVALFASLLLFLVAFLGNFGVGLPAFFGDPAFSSAMRTLFRVTPFLWLLWVCKAVYEGGEILRKATKSFLVFLFLAVMETALIAVTNLWGYDFSELIYDFVPGSVFQVVALLFLLHFFLAYTPAFLEDKKRWARVAWRLLSLAPLSLLTLNVILSNAHLLFYDVPKNLFLSFWFPSSVLSATMASVLILYGQFFLRLFFHRRYGEKAAFFLNGDRFALYANVLCAAAFLAVYGFMMALRDNEYAYYLQLTDGEWLLTLIPLFLLSKSAPSLCPPPREEAPESNDPPCLEEERIKP